MQRFNLRVLLAIVITSLAAALVIGLRIVDLFPCVHVEKPTVMHVHTLSDYYSGVSALFTVIYNVSVRGVDVSRSCALLNDSLYHAYLFRKTGDRIELQRATALLRQASVVLLQEVRQFNDKQQSLNMITVCLTASLPPLAYVLATIVAPYLYRRFKLWYLSSFIVVPETRKLQSQEEEKKVVKSRVMDEEVQAVVIAIVIVVTVFVIAYLITKGKVVEPFSAIGLLGPAKKIGGYPREVAPGETFRLWIYLHNYEGHAMLYRIYVKLGPRTTFVNSTTPANATVIDYLDFCLAHNQTALRPYTMSIDKPGQYKLIFELWYWDPAEKKYVYKGQWTHLYINVTSS